MTSREWQLGDDSASRYEKVAVPAILGPFAKALVDWAEMQSGDVVIDVGCGTGAATRPSAEKLGESGKVIGTDVNEGMLRVAQSLPPVSGAPIEWKQDSVYDLSFDDESADVVLSAQMLQFLPDRQKALSEMRRILKTGKALYISLWCDIGKSPYFDALLKAIATHIGEDTAAGLGAGFNLTDISEIVAMVQEAGFADVTTKVSELILPLPPMAEFVPKHINATPMSVGYNNASESAQQAMLDEITQKLASYQVDSGLAVPFRSHLIKAVK